MRRFNRAIPQRRRVGASVALHLRTMSKPRQVLPGQFYLITRRCTQRQFLMRPDSATNNAFIYCLAEAAQRFEIDVLLPVAQANHHHTVIFDRHGRCPQFIEHFHKMFARCQNALRGRFENLWAAQEPCVTQLVDRGDVIEKLIYTATNPVKDGLVERVHHWPGVNGYGRLLQGRPMRATRPHHFFRQHGSMPLSATLELTIPLELGFADEVLRAVKAGVEAVEHEKAEERRRTGKRVFGRRRVLQQSWRESPASTEVRFALRPRFAAGNPASRVTALQRYRDFLADYREARRDWLAGVLTHFPIGTYWLRRFASVAIAPMN